METVNNLLPGDKGIIANINAQSNIKKRLMDMGIIEGVEIEMIRTAPLGDPIEIKVHNTLIALRKNEAGNALLVSSSGKGETRGGASTNTLRGRSSVSCKKNSTPFTP